MKKVKRKNTKNKKGFTLIELIATISVLAIVIGVAGAAFISIKNKTLEGDYSNLISFIETKAAKYAKETGITTISVEDLIKAGEILPTDETDIYNPVNNKSINCYLIKSDYIDGEYVARIIENDNRNSDGTCKEYTRTTDYTICEYEGEKCVDIKEEWHKDNVTLGVKRRGESGEVINDSSYNYAWLSSTSQTGSEPTIVTNIETAATIEYQVEVVMEDTIAEAHAKVMVDKEAPSVLNIEVDPNWAKEKEVKVTTTDYEGSGVDKAIIKSGTIASCPTNASEYNLKVTDNIVSTTINKEGEFYVCLIDKVGNVTSEPNIGTVDKIDGEAVLSGDISLTKETNEWVRSMTLTGKATDHKSGLMEFAFTTNSNTPNSWTKLTNGPTNEQITKTLSVDTNGTYYFWVKDLVGNIKPYAYVDVALDKEIDSASISKSTTDWTSSLTITGKATDTKSKITHYAFTTSTSTPSSSEWISVGSTPQTSITKTLTLSSPPSRKTYYFWVKDKAGNVKNSTNNQGGLGIDVSNIGTLVTTSFSTGELSSRSYTSDAYFYGIKKVESISVRGYNGSVTNYYVSGNYLEYSVNYGSVKTGTKNGSCTDSTYLRNRLGISYCTSMYCSEGGRQDLTSLMCREPYDMYYGGQKYLGGQFDLLCDCRNGAWNCDRTGSPYTVSCPTHYIKEWEENKDNPVVAGDKCSPNGSSINTKGRTYYWCTWQGDYRGECTSTDYSCNYDEVKSGGYCYYCSYGSINYYGTACTYSCLKDYSYYEYTIDLQYIKG